MPQSERGGLGQEEAGQCPPLQRRGLRQHGGVEVVVDPEGVEAELLDGAGPEEYLVIREGDLWDVDAEVDVGGRGRRRGWGHGHRARRLVGVAGASVCDAPVGAGVSRGEPEAATEVVRGRLRPLQ